MGDKVRKISVSFVVALMAATPVGAAWAISDQNPDESPLVQNKNASALYDDGKFHGSNSPGCHTMSFGNDSFSFSMHATQNGYGVMPPQNSYNSQDRFHIRSFAGTDAGSPNSPPSSAFADRFSPPTGC